MLESQLSVLAIYFGTLETLSHRFDLFASHSYIMVVSEITLLRARDPSITNSDDWPVFPLKRVKIVSHSTGLPVSLFTAHQGHAIRVVGYLDKVGAENAHMSECLRPNETTVETPDSFTL